MVPRYHVKDSGHSSKGAGGMVQLNTHLPTYMISNHAVNWCMFQNEVRPDGSSLTWHQPYNIQTAV